MKTTRMRENIQSGEFLDCERFPNRLSALFNLIDLIIYFMTFSDLQCHGHDWLEVSQRFPAGVL